jgi:putative membrane-bound dehydrogenase-like protein
MKNLLSLLALTAIVSTSANAADPAQPPARPRRQPPSAEHQFGPEAARQEVQALTVGEGLQATLFACEPMVVNPCDMDIDERGRVWVTEGANYRISLHPQWGVIRPEGDRIVVLEDTKGTGAADKQTVFYQDHSINAALGICVLGNKVIVSSAPNVFLLTDTDGDGVADKREILFTGISGFDHDHAVHAFVFGPDGKFYFNFGNAGRQLRRPTGKLKEVPLHGVISKEDIAANSEPLIDVKGIEVSDKAKPYREGMVFRCNPDGSEFEVLAWNFRNNYEVAVDSFGTLWQSDNDDDGNRGVRINYVMEYGNYGFKDEMTGAAWGDGWKKAQSKGESEDQRPFYHWHQYDPGVVPNLLQTGNGSPTGILFYEGKLLPKVFQNQIIHADAGPRTVRAYTVETDGAGYHAAIKDILTSSNSWYRPSDVCIAPDGSLLIADWHDAVVGGHNMVDRELDKMTGRIYRVAPPGSKYSVPKYDFKSAAGCIEALKSPNISARYLAWTALHGMGAKAEKDLAKLWSDADPRLRARALHLLARLPGKEKKYVETALKDKDADIRITALRTARELKLDVVSYVKQLAKDPSPQVRRECAIALRHNQSTDAPKLWATLAQQHDGKDRWYLEALGIAADQQEDKFFDAWLSSVGDKWNTPAGRDVVWRSRATKSPALLVKIISDKSTSPKDKEHYMRALDFVKGPEKEKALIDLLGVN